MKFVNYQEILDRSGRPEVRSTLARATVHKDDGPSRPRVSFILLDWECRERFNTLDWLRRQDVPKDEYELIWVELYDRVVPEVLEKADILITCHQRAMYHKHEGYNVGLLKARGEIIIVCDSDAVFPRDFVSSVYAQFEMSDGEEAIPLVLMHHEWRTTFLYPDELDDAEDLKDERWQWWPLIPNAGACMSVRRQDAVRFGGFDEDQSLRGYLCGPYDLGWRLVNAGIPQRWHDESVALWHFAHPDPVATNGFLPSFERLSENTYPHVDMHAITAVDAFSSGRMLPLTENLEIWDIRMAGRAIGTEFEHKYGVMTGPEGFHQGLIKKLRFGLMVGKVTYFFKQTGRYYLRRTLKRLIGEARTTSILFRLRTGLKIKRPTDIELMWTGQRANVIRFGSDFLVVPHALGAVDFYRRRERNQPNIVRLNNLDKAIALVGSPEQTANAA